MIPTRLFTPLKIKNLTLKNRVVMPALHHLYTPEGYATDRFNRYYWRRAEGGAALIFVGGCRFDDYGGAPSMMSLQDDSFIPGYRAFTDGMHERGCLTGVQLYHAGGYAYRDTIPGGGEALAPSAGYSKFTREQCREITRAEIRQVIRDWADAAVRAQKAGFDVVEILGSAGYLICQFLSPLKNRRTDEYGGSWENRTRFAREVVSEVRAAVGPDYPLCMRIAGNDFVPGSNTNEEAVLFCRLMERCGIDMFNVTGGWHESVVPQITGDLPRGGFSYLAAAVHDAVHVPVIVSNRISDPMTAERILATGQGDLVSVGRAMIADPDWAKKAQSGMAEEIRPCMACNQGCLARTFFRRPIECLVNAWAGREDQEPRGQAEQPKRLLVVGGGPAGCEFAIRAAQRGHQVTLWEKGARIGGQLPLVAAPPGKQEFRQLIRYYETILERTRVEVVLNREATVENVSGAGFDGVIVAAGMNPVQLTLPGDQSVEIVTAYSVLGGETMPGKRVLVVGGGSVGCETAQFLARESCASPELIYFLLANQAEKLEKVVQLTSAAQRTIGIVDIARIGTGFESGTGWPVMKDLKRLGVQQFPGCAIEEIKQGVVTLKPVGDEAKEPVYFPADTIVLAVGARPNDVLARELESAGIMVHCVGDADRIGKILDAVQRSAQLAADL